MLAAIKKYQKISLNKSDKMKIKCPKCNHEFETIENPSPVLRKPLVKAKRLGTVAMLSQPVYDDMTYGVKSGYKDIINTIDKHKGATWTELKNETTVSTATLAKRLHEGKRDGIIDEDIRKSTGKKVYKLRQ